MKLHPFLKAGIEGKSWVERVNKLTLSISLSDDNYSPFGLFSLHITPALERLEHLVSSFPTWPRWNTDASVPEQFTRATRRSPVPFTKYMPQQVECSAPGYPSWWQRTEASMEFQKWSHGLPNWAYMNTSKSVYFNWLEVRYRLTTPSLIQPDEITEVTNVLWTIRNMLWNAFTICRV